QRCRPESGRPKRTPARADCEIAAQVPSPPVPTEQGLASTDNAPRADRMRCRWSQPEREPSVPENHINDAKPVLTYPGGEYPMTIAQAAEGNDGIDLGKLLASTGYTTYDPGFVNTASTKSAITYIDGEQGILRYRGYPIEQLADNSTFIELSYLLIYGELPTQDQLEDFTDKIRRH